jgi:hypothetical protein
MNDTTHEPTDRLTRPAALNANLFVTPDHVDVVDLTDHRGDLVSLRLGDDDARVSVLGALDEIIAVAEAAVAELRRVHDEREATR